ncbi:MAG: Smr/MutS family protein [Trueperaceae bacterium]|nr:Smr/MutS family protein [Trueperaceae bacterium]
MQVAPTTLEKLAFDRVTEALAERCQTLAGQARARAVRPDLDAAGRDEAHERVDEALLGDAIALGGVEDVRPLVARVMDGGVLDGPECLAIAYTMDAAATVKRAVAAEGRPRLTELVGRMGSFDAALRLVREQLDAQGEVRDDATPKLREIRRRLHPMRGRIRERMAQLLQQYASFVQDPIVTLRRDRYVIPVRASSQSRVPGLVLDTSDSGATVFVEPAAVVPMNNELALLEFEERDEVRRILVALGQRLAFDPALAATLEALAELDLVAASARLARDWRLARPDVAPEHGVRLPGARHPLIEACVPNDVVLDEDGRLLVLTGPNAGGKTVLLKTLGLAVLMAHAGLFVAAGAAASGAARGGSGRPSRVALPAFDAVLTDIGDEQSLEASLSTYAAHLTNLKRIVEHAGPRTLVLIDELGSGTDPDEGAALSQAILEAVLEQRAFGVVTTHLAPLKVFATQRDGVRNAAMRFDVEQLRPTFELVVGQPGRSYALAIAERVGMGAELLARAAEVLGPEGARLERLLETLERQREALQHELDDARGARDAAVGEAEVLRRQIERLRAQEAAVLEQAAAKADAMLQETLERARTARAAAKADPAQRGKAVEAIAQLRRETRARAAKPPKPPSAPAVGVGAVVRVEAYGAEGPVVEDRGDALLVQLGLLKVEVPRHEAVLVRGAERPKDSAPVAPGAGFERELNVRGERVEDALELVRTFVEEAHALKLESVRVLHGKGTGALRDAVRRYLRDDRRVERFEDAVPYEGGFGVTVVWLRG